MWGDFSFWASAQGQPWKNNHLNPKIPLNWFCMREFFRNEVKIVTGVIQNFVEMNYVMIKHRKKKVHAVTCEFCVEKTFFWEMRYDTQLECY